jgi:hypothetical protein
MELIAFISFILWITTMIWFTRRINSMTKAATRTADSIEMILALQRSEAKRQRSLPAETIA